MDDVGTEWVNIGSIIGAAVVNATKGRLDKGSYQIPLGTLFIVPVFLTIGLFFVPESPRYLVYKGDLKAGRASLEALRGHSLEPEELELEWAEMVEGIEEEKRIAHTIGPLDMFRGPDLRRTLLCHGIIATQSGSGAWFMISYATYFMIVAGLSVEEAFKFSVMNTCLGFVGVNLGIFAMRHLCGRRTILMFGAVVQALSMLGMAVGPTTAMAQGNRDAVRGSVIAFTGLFMFTYNAFGGNASYPAATEMVSTRLRAWTVGSATSLGYLLAWLTGFCSPYFINPENLNWVSRFSYSAYDEYIICCRSQTDLKLLLHNTRGLSMLTSGPGPTFYASSSSTSASRRRRTGRWRKSMSSSPMGSRYGSLRSTRPRYWTRR